MTFYGKIVNGELQIISYKKVVELFKSEEDGLVEITCKRKDQRSLAQNKYLHGVLIPEFRKAMNSVGYRLRNDGEAKRVFKATFLTRHITNELTQEEMPIVLDTSAMSKEEMSALYDEVIQFAAEHLDGYQIPYPGEKMKLDL